MEEWLYYQSIPGAPEQISNCFDRNPNGKRNMTVFTKVAQRRLNSRCNFQFVKYNGHYTAH